MSVVAKEKLFTDLGYGSGWESLEVCLEEAGLSHRRKSNIDDAKSGGVRGVLTANFARCCGRGDCEAAARSERREVLSAATQADCDFCGGGVNDSKLLEMAAACRKRGFGRLCVVGGSKETRAAIEAAVGDELELRLVDGTARHTGKQAKANTAWADLVVVWGGTELDHKVSNHYRGVGALTVKKRGVAALAEAVTARVSAGRGKPR